MTRLLDGIDEEDNMSNEAQTLVPDLIVRESSGACAEGGKP
jgi:hypothetical protein